MLWKLLLAVVAGLAIGVALGALVWRWMALRQRGQQRQRHLAQHHNVIDSLEILSRALLQGQVDSSEASIRMSVLLHSLPADVRPKVDLAAIHQLAEACAGFHRGEQRQRLAPRERNRQDFARLQLEDEQADAVRAATARLHDVLDRWRTRLSPDRG